jgi:hypothetical protein
MDVTVGVNVSGVGVVVAKRFCVGIGVSLIKGVADSAGRVGVREARSGGKLGRFEQPARIVASKRSWMFFFMVKPLLPSSVLMG